MNKASRGARALAAKAVWSVLHQGRSLSQALPAFLDQAAAPDRPLVQELAYGVLRWRFRLDALLHALMPRSLKAKDQDVACLLRVGLYQLGHTEVSAHAAINETVEAVRATGKGWAVAMANAVLRNYQRRREALNAQVDAHPAARYAHPDWLIDALRADWPDDYRRILEENNRRPPFVLRVNTQRIGADEYRAALTAAGSADAVAVGDAALWLPQPVAVERLPGFTDGWVSVQDAAAQLAAPLLDVLPGMRVLDACAAPGGKTAHILERTPGLAELVALDIEPARLRRVEENLARLQLAASLVQGDALQPDRWWDGRAFDRILLDAPCSATGVIRRHPDIKSLRRAGDIDQLAATQGRMLDALWPLLAPGGMLLYATCSVLRRENAQQIERFLGRHADAAERPLSGEWGRSAGVGRQILPGDAGGSEPAGTGAGMDGFYYAGLTKRPEGG